MTSRTPAQYDWTKALFNDRRLTKNFTSPRRGKISHVTLHHMTIVAPASQPTSTVAVEGAYKTWMGGRAASANYGVSGELVWQYVSDFDAAWSDANSTSNNSTLSIEHANSSAAPGWKISDATMQTGARLVATLHRLYGLGRPSRKTVRVHRDYYATACPGPYMMAHLDEYIAASAKFYDGVKPSPKPKPVDPTPEPTATVKVTSALQNLAGAAPNTYGVKTASARVKRYIAARKATPVTSLLAQEVNLSMLGQLDAGLTGMHRGPSPKNGRYVWVSKAAKIIDSGVFTAPASYLKDTKQCAWGVYEIDGALSCEGSMHLEQHDGGTPDKVRVQQADYFADQLLAKAKAHKVPLGNVLLGGDTNSNGMVVAALTAKHWRNVAAGGVFADTYTFMDWSGKARERFDYALVYDGPGATPIKAQVVAIAHNTQISDHAGLRVERYLTK